MAHTNENKKRAWSMKILLKVLKTLDFKRQNKNQYSTLPKYAWKLARDPWNFGAAKTWVHFKLTWYLESKTKQERSGSCKKYFKP